MLDIDKQIAYWRDGSAEDWDVAAKLVGDGHARHGLFFAHLAIEKMIKAHVARASQEVPPKSHNLLYLAGVAGITLTTEQAGFLSMMNGYQVAGRYPETLPPPVASAIARDVLDRCREFLQWLTRQF